MNMDVSGGNFCSSRIQTSGTLTRCKARGGPVTVAERSKACTVFARSEAGIVASNPTQGMDV
jgi:hypothetical protein